MVVKFYFDYCVLLNLIAIYHVILSLSMPSLTLTGLNFVSVPCFGQKQIFLCEEKKSTDSGKNYLKLTFMNNEYFNRQHICIWHSNLY
jgi:hypothetical protein